MEDDEDDPRLDAASARYPSADMTPAEFEEFVTSFVRAASKQVHNLEVKLHDVIVGTDGSYDFDGTARFEVAEMQFLTVIEAKYHKNAIKRELVQVLHSKMLSVGAQKAVLFSTASFQSGAVSFAKVHGVALVKVTEGRFTYETKSRDQSPAITREQALAWFGLPTFVGIKIERGDSGSTQFGSIRMTDGEWIATHILGSNGGHTAAPSG